MRQYVVQRVAALSDGHHLQPHVLEDEALLPVGTEEHLFAVAQRDGPLGARGLVGGERRMGLVVEDHAVLEHLDDRHAFVLGCRDDSFESCTSMSIERAKNVPLAPITSSPGLNGFSTVP